MKRYEIHTRKGRVLQIEAEDCNAVVLGEINGKELGHQRVVLFGEGDAVIASFYDADFYELVDRAEVSE